MTEIHNANGLLRKSQILDAPTCGTCKRDMMPNLINCTPFGHAGQQWVLTWRCEKEGQHNA